MVPPGPLIYDVVFPINSSAHVLRPAEGDIGIVTVRIEIPAIDHATWREVEDFAAPYAQQRIQNIIAPGGGIGLGRVPVAITGGEKRPADAREIPGREGTFVWEVSVQKHTPKL